ncbi:hypothetical protein GFY24_00865 [Nocardia sp. SYP-A9097]|uniref:hypothetical protein n=1 Tax=Nocardia sp. SYP-A9097 TaxID=2663237 RepID=UPI00129AF752|nr:hypothetical protein [Nocardia sp. SYP-A9097]MRH86029.1 hypothetical protein [Nocardia sp. SYP-A9097]
MNPIIGALLAWAVIAAALDVAGRRLPSPMLRQVALVQALTIGIALMLYALTTAAIDG